MSDNARPFDVLEDMIGDPVEVERHDGTILIGELVAFDQHINMSLKEVKVIGGNSEKFDATEVLHESNKYFQRGSSVKSVNPKTSENRFSE